MSILKLLKPKTNPLGLVLMVCALFAFQVDIVYAKSFDDVVIKGKVTSSTDGMPLPGVSVADSKNPSIGVVTDANGNYQIKVSSTTTTLKFSYLGFVTKEVAIAGKKVINVSLDEDVSKLDEVVVVGYGTQKKVNQTGSTETVRFGDAVNTPVTNSGQLMYGKFSGVQITQGSGLPGNDASSVVIRGVGTFGSSNPLVVIDNIQYTGLAAFNNLSPSDIESVSVLKDASAGAIYGARGANGVIIVTTKKGKSGAMAINYNGYTGYQDVTVVPHYLDAVNYAKLRNETDINLNNGNPNTPLRYSDADIQAIIDGSNPDQYANTNWASEILRTAPIQNHYLSFSGGSDKTTYRVSAGYLNQQAIVKGNFKSERYNLSFSLDSKVKDWLNINNNTNAYWTKFKGPNGGADAITGETGIINQFQRSSPTIPAYYSNGDFGSIDGSYYNALNPSYPSTNPLRTGVNGDHLENTINIADRLGAKVNFTKELSFETSGSINLNYGLTSNFIPTSKVYGFDGSVVTSTDVNTLNQGTNLNYTLLNENILRYAKTFNKKHDLAVLAGHSVSYTRNSNMGGSLQDFPSNYTRQFDAGGILNPNINGNAVEVALQSFFGRVNYSYDGKYLFEVNLRRDGSSRFGPKNRYGNFPSASAGWRISEEKFMKKVNWISELKLRGSWGITGNDNIDNYIWQQTYSPGAFYILGLDQVVGGVALSKLANTAITWEQVNQYDIGLDADLFKNSLSVTADYFKRNSSKVLYSYFPIPSTVGVTNIAAQNAADMVNSGLELTLNYRGKINKVNYSLGANVSKYADNKVTSLGYRGVKTTTARNIIDIGVPFNAYYGYKEIGVFQSQDEINNAPVQFGNINNTKPGDLKFADLSGPDGVPDGKVDQFDRTVIGNPFPKWIYSFNASVNFKGFDLSALFQGVQKVDRLLMDNGQQGFAGDRNNSLAYWINRWTPTNPSTTLPRLGGANNNVVSSFFIQDASYLRLKNLELGYSLPTLFTQKYGVSKVRVYLSGQNILTFTKMKDFDPERQRGNGTDLLAPLYKVYTLGLNVKF